MKKKKTILYLVILGILLLGAVLGIVVNLIMGNSLAAMFSSKVALTIYIGIGAFLIITATLLIIEWGHKE